MNPSISHYDSMGIGGHNYFPVGPNHHPGQHFTHHPTEHGGPMSMQSAMHVNPYGMPYPGTDMHGYFGQPPSFDSSGSHSNGPMQPPPQWMAPYPPYIPPWAVVPPPTLVVDISPSDVLCGRGGATNSHSGNKKFRALVKDHQDRYLQAKKRDKPAVASVIVDMIREKGGRFLRRYDTDPTGQVRWVDIGDDRAREKTCQALRENAPELRRRRLATSSSEEDQKIHTRHSESFSPKLSPNHSSSSSIKSPAPVPASEITLHHHQSIRQSEAAINQREEEGPIMIRPYTRLLPGQLPVDPIPLEKLSPHDRSLYLQDFLPPCPPIRSKPDQANQRVISRKCDWVKEECSY